MFNFRNILLLSIIITFLSLISVTYCTGQPTQFLEIEKNLKKTIQFDSWPGKNKDLRNGINLSKEKLLTLSGANEITPKHLFFITQKEDGQSFVSYRSQWRESDKDFTEITLSFLHSGIEAHEYLFNQYIMSSTMPLYLKENSQDKIPIAGDVSFYKGEIFIRNNIVIKIHAEGKMSSLTENIAKEIDKLLLTQDIADSYDKYRPRIVKDSIDKKIIIEP